MNTALATGARIRQLREGLGYSRERFAELIGSTAQNLGEWERGKVAPRALTLAKIVKNTGCDSFWLAGESSSKETIGQRIRRIRMAQGMRIIDLAEKVQATHTTINLLENGKKGTNMFTFIEVARALGVSLDHLAYGTMPATVAHSPLTP